MANTDWSQLKHDKVGETQKNDQKQKQKIFLEELKKHFQTRQKNVNYDKI